VLRRLLADRKNREIRCLDLRPPVLPLGRLRYERVDVRDGDLGRHLEGCDVVVHLAAVVTAHVPRETLDAVNVGGTKNVLAAAAAAGVRQVIYSSSVSAFGCVPGHALPLVEGSPRRRDPVLPYAMTKYDVEEWLDGFERDHPALAVVRLRPGIVVGERIEHFLGGLLRLGVLLDPGGVPMPVIWDEDVAEAVALAIAKGARGAFNLAAEEPRSPSEIARAVGLRRVPLPRGVPKALQRGLARLGVPPRVDPAWFDVPLDADLTTSSERARRELGWIPRCPTAIDVYRRFVEVVPRRLDPRLALFFRLVAAASRRRPPPDEARHVRADVHLALSGRRGGDVALRFDEGRLDVRVGEVPRPPTSVVRTSPETLLALLSGALDLARAQLTGKLLIDGDPVAGFLVGGIVGTFRASRLGHWLRSNEA
jgi:nucleoside-diphosphate-sugar epimerase